MKIFHIVIIGIVSCLTMDMWQRLLKLLYDINPSDRGVGIPWFFFMPVLGKGFLGIKTQSLIMAYSLSVRSPIATGAPICGFYQIFRD